MEMLENSGNIYLYLVHLFFKCVVWLPAQLLHSCVKIWWKYALMLVFLLRNQNGRCKSFWLNNKSALFYASEMISFVPWHWFYDWVCDRLHVLHQPHGETSFYVVSVSVVFLFLCGIYSTLSFTLFFSADPSQTYWVASSREHAHSLSYYLKKRNCASA